MISYHFRCIVTPHPEHRPRRTEHGRSGRDRVQDYSEESSHFAGLYPGALRSGRDEFDYDVHVPLPLDYSSPASAPRPTRWAGVHAAATLLTGGIALLMSYVGYARGFAGGEERVTVYLLITLSTALLAMSCVRLRTARRTTDWGFPQRTILLSAILAAPMIAAAVFFCAAARFG